MDYDSLSSIVLAVMAAVLILGWLPRRTIRGMKRASEHREDRYSSSLHIVGANDATRFSDGGSQQTKGLSMGSQQHRNDSAHTQERIARIRTMRREAVRRRQIVVSVLVVVTAVVAVLAFSMQFSPLFIMIPALLLVVVLALGAKASADARRWEQDLADSRRNKPTQQQERPRTGVGDDVAVGGDSAAGKGGYDQAQPVYTTLSRTDALSAEHADRIDHASGSSKDEGLTNVLAASEIHDVLRKAQQDKQRALTQRQERRDRQEALHDAQADQMQSAPNESERGNAVKTPVEQSPSSADAASAVDDAQRADQPSAHEKAEVADATKELHVISPSPALDAFEMAASQDLISFSLGGSRDASEGDVQEAQSLEIKSQRQVSKAVPKQRKPLGDGSVNQRIAADADAKAADAQAVEAREIAQDPDRDETLATGRFHDAETTADVDAPEQTSDSLGVSLESILARRVRS